MTEFKSDDYVKILHTDYPGTDLQVGEIRRVLRGENGPGGDAWLIGISNGKASELFFCGHELQLIEPEKETEVTEFKKGDKVRILKDRNAFGDDISWRNLAGKIVTLVEVADLGYTANERFDPKFTPWRIEEDTFWVRSDDIELVSRPSETNVLDSLVSDRLEAEEKDEAKLPKYREFIENLFSTKSSGASFCFDHHEYSESGFGVSIFIDEDEYWEAEDLRELADLLNKLAKRIDKKTAKQERKFN